MDEFALIRRYFAGHGRGSGVPVGIGDDGAVLEPAPGMQQVQVIDTLVEGVHFPSDLAPADVGYRAVAVNLSDIAAMGAVPRWMTLALSLPAADEEWLDGFASGLHTAAAEYDVALVGGDTTRAPVAVITVHISGDVEPGGAILRSGAKPGDTVYVTGTLGDAAAGLRGLREGDPVRELLWRFTRPAARVRVGRALRGVASAAIDVSDGLLGDLGKLLLASGVGARLDVETLPISPPLAAHFGADEQRRFALSGGDDYELCFTASRELPDTGIVPVTAIGTVVEGAGIELRLDGEPFEHADAGYRHFADDEGGA